MPIDIPSLDNVMEIRKGLHGLKLKNDPEISVLAQGGEKFFEALDNHVAKTEFSPENTNFLVEASKLIKAGNASFNAQIENFHNKFIKQGGDSQVNIPSEERRKIEQCVQQSTTNPGRFTVSRSEYEASLKNAINRIVLLLNQDSMRRFTVSEQFQTVCASSTESSMRAIFDNQKASSVRCESWYEKTKAALEGFNTFYDNVPTTLSKIDKMTGKYDLALKLKNEIDNITIEARKAILEEDSGQFEKIDVKLSRISAAVAHYKWCQDQELTMRLLSTEAEKLEKSSPGYKKLGLNDNLADLKARLGRLISDYDNSRVKQETSDFTVLLTGFTAAINSLQSSKKMSNDESPRSRSVSSPGLSPSNSVSSQELSPSHVKLDVEKEKPSKDSPKPNPHTRKLTVIVNKANPSVSAEPPRSDVQPGRRSAIIHFTSATNHLAEHVLEKKKQDTEPPPVLNNNNDDDESLVRKLKP